MDLTFCVLFIASVQKSHSASENRSASVLRGNAEGEPNMVGPLERTVLYYRRHSYSDTVRNVSYVSQYTVFRIL